MNIDRLFDEIVNNPERIEHLVLGKEDYDGLIVKLETAPEQNPRLEELLRRKAPWE